MLLQVAVCCVFVAVASAAACFDNDYYGDCPGYVEKGYCQESSSFYSYMKNYCQKSCGFCSVGIGALCDDIHSGVNPNLLKVDGSQCDRACGGEQYHCEFEMWYKHKFVRACNDSSKACFGDGHERQVTIITTNPYNPALYTLPGPPIVVCEGDIVTVKMHNGLETGSMATHWHGLHMLPSTSSTGVKGEPTQWADGVPYITQCPTVPGDSFDYIFMAEPAGTYWYHSHMAYHADDGSFGSLVVRENSNGETQQHLSQSLKNLIDDSCDVSANTIMVTDWYDNLSSWRHSLGFQPPRNILINGKGRSYKENPGQKIDSFTPWNVFTVNKAKDNCSGKKNYRFRIIGTQSLNCKIQISIDGMKLNVIATDGQFVEPTEVSSLVISNGERYDILIPADDPSNQGVYTMRFGGLTGCGYFKYSAVAFIQYDESHEIDQETRPDWDKSTTVPGLTLNGFAAGDLTVANLKSSFPFIYKGKAQKTFYMQFTPSPHGFTPTLFNNIAFNPGHMKKPLLSQDHGIDFSHSCSAQTAQGLFQIDTANIDHSCYHILEVGLGDVVDMFLINPGNSRHPIHMHGYHFRVIAEGTIENPNPNVNYVADIKKLNELGGISKNFDHPVKKDTLQSKIGGWQLIRFHANNPGYWFTHCHNSFHHVNGMGFVLKVGNRADWNIPRDFPTCGMSHTCSALVAQA